MLRSERKWDEAETLLREALNAAPTLTPAISNIAYCCFMQSDLGELHAAGSGRGSPRCLNQMELEDVSPKLQEAIAGMRKYISTPE